MVAQVSCFSTLEIEREDIARCKHALLDGSDTLLRIDSAKAAI